MHALTAKMQLTSSTYMYLNELMYTPPLSYLVSLDIESLYTNINSFDMAIKVFLEIFAQRDKLVLYLELLKFVFKNDIFQFNGKAYHQICGIAMGTEL